MTATWPLSVRRLARGAKSAVLAVLDPIGPVCRLASARESSSSVSYGWIAALSLVTGIAFAMLAVSHFGGRRGELWAEPLFWTTLGLLFFFWAGRIAWPGVARQERALLLLLLALALFGVKVLYAPTSLVQFDEFLHWITFNDVVEERRLFLDNPMLPVSPLYPGLEIVASAVANVGGVSIIPTATLVVAVLRALFTCTLFLLYERYSGSPRLAAIACLVYMGSSNFVLFDAQFAYQSLAVVFLVLALLAEADARPGQPNRRASLVVFLPLFLFGLAVTHHLSSYFAAAFLAMLAGLEIVRPSTSLERLRLAAVAVLAFALPTVWSWLIGNPTSGYLGPILEKGAGDLSAILSGTSVGREFFVAEDGSSIPLFLQVVAMASVGLLSLGLATGFLRTLALSALSNPSSLLSGWARIGGDDLRPPHSRPSPLAVGRDLIQGMWWTSLLKLPRRRWQDSRLLLLALLTLAYPLSVVLRLVPSTWEVGNRMAAFVFLGVGLVVAVSITFYWAPLMARGRATLAIAGALTIVFLGGVVGGWGVAAERKPYKVSADALSVEPMGIEAAEWAREWLGEGNRFAADRINRLLIATYGRQEVVTALHDGIDISSVFFHPTFSSGELEAIKRGRVDYVLVDLRLSQARAFSGHYYELYGAEKDYGGPPEPSALLKFNRLEGVSRVFDNGSIVIFDVRGLRHDR